MLLEYFQACPIGPEANILEPSAEQCKRLFLEQPILSLDDFGVIKATKYRGWKVKTSYAQKWCE